MEISQGMFVFKFMMRVLESKGIVSAEERTHIENFMTANGYEMLTDEFLEKCLKEFEQHGR